MTSVRSPFPMVVTYTLASRGAATEAGVRIQGGAGPLFRLAAPLIAWRVRRSVREDLRRLKRRLEDRNPASSGRV
jgi:hypothetical protein